MERIQGNSLMVKEVNSNLVRRVFRQKRSATKQDLSRETGLSVVTVNSILQRLMIDGEVKEGVMVPSNGGRPSQLYEYNGDFSMILTICARQKGPRELIMSRVVNLFDEIVYKEEAEVKEIAFDTFENIIARILVDYPRITAIGFGLPGVEYQGKVLFNDYKNIEGTDFVGYYHKRFKVPIIWENDVNAAVMGFYHRHYHEEEKHIMAIYFPDCYGPGSGIIIDGKLYRGKNNFAGEIAGLPYFDWEHLAEPDYVRVLKTVSCVLAPEIIVLYRTSWEGIDQEEIRLQFLDAISEYMRPDLVFSLEFDSDYELGTIMTTRKRTEEPLMLVHRI